jgi:hypothetical protein
MGGRRGGWLRPLLYAALAALYLLHNDLWLWNDPRRILGLPVGLAYHLGFCLACSLLMELLVRFAWPLGLVEEAEREGAVSSAPNSRERP